MDTLIALFGVSSIITTIWAIAVILLPLIVLMINHRVYYIRKHTRKQARDIHEQARCVDKMQRDIHAILKFYRQDMNMRYRSVIGKTASK